MQPPVLATDFVRHQDPKIAAAILSLAQEVSQLAADSRYPQVVPRLLVVGGYVRDMLRKEVPKDADVEVYGVSPAALAALLLRLYPGQVRDVGKSFGILKVVWDAGGDCDVAVPRKERKVGQRHQDFVVDADPALSVREALRRRDFTVNAIAWDPLSGELIDPFGGIADVERGILEVVDTATFVEDPLRVYRGVQFAARFGFSLSENTRTLLRDMVGRGELRYLAKERVTDEWQKLLLKSERPSVGLVLLQELGVLAQYFPEIAVLAETPQELDWHPEGDVFTHTCMVLDCAAYIIRDAARGLGDVEKEQVLLGALCHDLGKPGTTALDPEKGRIRSLGHEEEGVTVTKMFLQKFSFGSEAVAAVLGIVGNHLKPGMLFRSLEKGELNDKQYAGAVRKLLRRIAPASWRTLLAVAEADFRGRGIGTGPGAYHVEDGQAAYAAGEKLAHVVKEAQLEETLSTTLISGSDIVATARRLGVMVDPGPKFGEFIRAIEALREHGEIVTKEDALARLEEMMKNGSV